MNKQNITPEYIANAVKNIEDITSKKLKLYANKDTYDAEMAAKGEKADWKMYYWPGVMDKDYEYFKKYGKPCIFLMGDSYRGLYHDDYASFTYWDNVEGKVIEDSWTTAAYCPSYDLYKWFPSMNEAWACGMVDKEAYAKMRRERMSSTGADNRIPDLGYMWREYRRVPKFIPVTVNGGRKWKGFGLLLNFKHIPGFRGGVHVAEIYDPIEHTVREVNYTYVEVVKEFLDGWHAWSEKMIASRTPDEWFFDGCPNNFDDYVKFVNPEAPSLEGAVYVEANERNMKALEKRREYIAKKMPGIREWVAKNTDKTGYEAEKLAAHIFRKNNSWLFGEDNED